MPGNQYGWALAGIFYFLYRVLHYSDGSGLPEYVLPIRSSLGADARQVDVFVPRPAGWRGASDTLLSRRDGRGSRMRTAVKHSYSTSVTPCTTLSSFLGWP